MPSQLRVILPLVALVVLAVVFVFGLQTDPRKLPSVFIDKPAPAFELPALAQDQPPFAPGQLRGQVWLLNVFASWCAACVVEHPYLLDIAEQHPDLPLVGLAYKDAPSDTRNWLRQRGDPFTRIAVDRDGLVGIDYGVYGVPETFVIDASGVIRYKHVGPIDGSFFDTHVAPLLRAPGA